MACSPEQTRLSQAFKAVLSETKSYRIDKGSCTCSGPTGSWRATFAPQSADLAGTAWRATGINNGKQAVASLVRDTTVTLAFYAEGRAGGSAGCNRYTTSYAQDGAKLTFKPAAATRMACTSPEVMAQEQAFRRRSSRWPPRGSTATGSKLRRPRARSQSS